jgi:hypothetical protein
MVFIINKELIKFYVIMQKKSWLAHEKCKKYLTSASALLVIYLPINKIQSNLHFAALNSHLASYRTKFYMPWLQTYGRPSVSLFSC